MGDPQPRPEDQKLTEVWIVGTDYADDEIFGVGGSREEAQAIADRQRSDSDLSLNVVRYLVPYPSPSTARHTCEEKRGAYVIGVGDVDRCGCGAGRDG